MTVVFTPYTFRTDGIVDDNLVNGNLRAGADYVNDNLSRRYTNAPPIIVPLDGVTDTMTTALRTIRFARPTANNPVEVVRVEFYCYAASGVTWTLSASGTGVAWDSITLDTAGATTEAYAVSTTPIAVPTGNGVDFVVSGSAAGTLTRAWLVLHVRCDRGVQGASPSFAPYTPTYVDSSVAAASMASSLDTQLTALAAAVTRDANAQSDLRCQCFVARNFSALQEWNMPSGAGMTGLGYNAYIVATAADEYQPDASLSGPALVATGTSNIVASTGTVASTNDDPTDTADDVLVQFGTITGTVELGYIFVWWE